MKERKNIGIGASGILCLIALRAKDAGAEKTIEEVSFIFKVMPNLQNETKDNYLEAYESALKVIFMFIKFKMNKESNNYENKNIGMEVVGILCLVALRAKDIGAEKTIKEISFIFNIIPNLKNEKEKDYLESYTNVLSNTLLFIINKKKKNNR